MIILDTVVERRNILHERLQMVSMTFGRMSYQKDLTDSSFLHLLSSRFDLKFLVTVVDVSEYFCIPNFISFITRV